MSADDEENSIKKIVLITKCKGNKYDKRTRIYSNYKTNDFREILEKRLKADVLKLGYTVGDDPTIYDLKSNDEGVEDFMHAAFGDDVVVLYVNYGIEPQQNDELKEDEMNETTKCRVDELIPSSDHLASEAAVKTRMGLSIRKRVIRGRCGGSQNFYEQGRRRGESHELGRSSRKLGGLGRGGGGLCDVGVLGDDGNDILGGGGRRYEALNNYQYLYDDNEDGQNMVDDGDHVKHLNDILVKDNQELVIKVNELNEGWNDHELILNLIQNDIKSLYDKLNEKDKEIKSIKDDLRKEIKDAVKEATIAGINSIKSLVAAQSSIISHPSSPQRTMSSKELGRGRVIKLRRIEPIKLNKSLRDRLKLGSASTYVVASKNADKIKEDVNHNDNDNKVQEEDREELGTMDNEINDQKDLEKVTTRHKTAHDQDSNLSPMGRRKLLFGDTFIGITDNALIHEAVITNSVFSDLDEFGRCKGSKTRKEIGSIRLDKEVLKLPVDLPMSKSMDVYDVLMKWNQAQLYELKIKHKLQKLLWPHIRIAMKKVDALQQPAADIDFYGYYNYDKFDESETYYDSKTYNDELEQYSNDELNTDLHTNYDSELEENCSNCGGIGHIARVCPSYKDQSGDIERDKDYERNRSDIERDRGYDHNYQQSQEQQQPQMVYHQNYYQRKEREQLSLLYDEIKGFTRFVPFDKMRNIMRGLQIIEANQRINVISNIYSENKSILEFGGFDYMYLFNKNNNDLNNINYGKIQQFKLEINGPNYGYYAKQFLKCYNNLLESEIKNEIKMLKKVDLFSPSKQSDINNEEKEEKVYINNLSKYCVGLQSRDDIGKHIKYSRLIRKLLSNEHQPPIQEIFDCDIIQRLIYLMQYSQSFQVKFECAWSLTNIASGTQQHSATLIKLNGIAVLINVFKNKQSIVEIKEQCLWELGNIAGDSVQCRNDVLSHDILKYLLPITRSYRNKPLPSFNYIILSLYAINIILKHEQSHLDIELITDCCWTLSYLSDYNFDDIEEIQLDLLSILLDSGIIDILIKLLLNDGSLTDCIKNPALRTIGNITTGSDILINKLLNKPSLTDCIKNHALRTIGNIATGLDILTNKLLNKPGILGAIANLLKNKISAIKRETLWLIANYFNNNIKNDIGRNNDKNSIEYEEEQDIDSEIEYEYVGINCNELKTEKIKNKDQKDMDFNVISITEDMTMRLKPNMDTKQDVISRLEQQQQIQSPQNQKMQIGDNGVVIGKIDDDEKSCNYSIGVLRLVFYALAIVSMVINFDKTRYFDDDVFQIQHELLITSGFEIDSGSIIDVKGITELNEMDIMSDYCNNRILSVNIRKDELKYVINNNHYNNCYSLSLIDIIMELERKNNDIAISLNGKDNVELLKDRCCTFDVFKEKDLMNINNEGIILSLDIENEVIKYEIIKNNKNVINDNDNDDLLKLYHIYREECDVFNDDKLYVFDDVLNDNKLCELELDQLSYHHDYELDEGVNYINKINYLSYCDAQKRTEQKLIIVRDIIFHDNIISSHIMSKPWFLIIDERRSELLISDSDSIRDKWVDFIKKGLNPSSNNLNNINNKDLLSYLGTNIINGKYQQNRCSFSSLIISINNLIIANQSNYTINRGSVSSEEVEYGLSVLGKIIGNDEFKLCSVRFNYTLVIRHSTVCNNGYNVQININQKQNECLLIIDNKIYLLKQFHFHLPSEHSIDSNQYEMEMYLVHNKKHVDDDIIVLSFNFLYALDLNRLFKNNKLCAMDMNQVSCDYDYVLDAEDNELKLEDKNGNNIIVSLYDKYSLPVNGKNIILSLSEYINNDIINNNNNNKDRYCKKYHNKEDDNDYSDNEEEQDIDLKIEYESLSYSSSSSLKLKTPPFEDNEVKEKNVIDFNKNEDEAVIQLIYFDLNNENQELILYLEDKISGNYALNVENERNNEKELKENLKLDIFKFIFLDILMFLYIIYPIETFNFFIFE